MRFLFSFFCFFKQVKEVERTFTKLAEPKPDPIRPSSTKSKQAPSAPMKHQVTVPQIKEQAPPPPKPEPTFLKGMLFEILELFFLY